jgi:hypothetical protein
MKDGAWTVNDYHKLPHDISLFLTLVVVASCICVCIFFAFLIAAIDNMLQNRMMSERLHILLQAGFSKWVLGFKIR